MLVDVVGSLPGLGTGTVIPDVAVVGEAVVDEASLALLLILDDWVERQILADLCVLRKDANSGSQARNGLRYYLPPAWRLTSGEPRRPC